eukprot:TRINITY_DN12503_c0_g1_i1.p1 TRINITY_DN12503_c0_g1~~TRINITY_DN12503_c0_g1_i1.p1  ORF type:complete len:649 (-),score=125.70 TRINITY_DN12503_c0_g1_i1:433-2379(-)
MISSRVVCALGRSVPHTVFRRTPPVLFASGFTPTVWGLHKQLQVNSRFGDLDGRKYYESRLRHGKWRSEGRPQKISQVDVSEFRRILGNTNVIDLKATTGLSDKYNADWMHQYVGTAQYVVKPGSIDDLCELLTYCWAQCIVTVPQGGNTSLVGGSVPFSRPIHGGDELIVSLERMNRIISADEDSGILRCEAGTILANAETAANAVGLTFPLDLGAKGSCQVGGNLATNAGGLRFMRWGSLRQSCVGMKVVMADGRLLDLLSGCALPKDNTGYDLKQLFIGSEGTLGIIAEAAFLCPPKPSSRTVVLLRARRRDRWRAILELRRLARRHLGEILSAMELIDGASVVSMGLAFPGDVTWPLSVLDDATAAGDTTENYTTPEPVQGRVRRPSFTTREAALDRLPPAIGSLQDDDLFMLVETLGSNAAHDAEKVAQFLETAMVCGAAVDGTMSETESQAAGLWNLRERVPMALPRHDGHVFKYDMSLPLDHFYELVETVRMRVRGSGAQCVVGFGHLGDFNLHLNVVAVDRTTAPIALKKVLEPFVYEWVAQHGGSVSAEHGIGQLKTEYLKLSKSPVAMEVMSGLKHLLDYNLLLNRDKMIPGIADADWKQETTKWVDEFRDWHFKRDGAVTPDAPMQLHTTKVAPKLA